MCRKRYLHGCCILFFGLGLMTGHYLDSWFLCCLGGIGLLVLGYMVMQKK